MIKRFTIIFLIIQLFLTAGSISVYSAGQGYFIENKGQWPDSVKYFAACNSGEVWITENSMVFDNFIYTVDKDNDSVRQGHVYRLDFIGQKRHNTEYRQEANQYPKFSYFLGNKKNKWAKSVNSYNDITAEDVFENIDVHFQFSAGGMRYDFVVNESADPSDIAMTITGADGYYIENNELVINTSLGPVHHGKIFAYQDIGKERNECSAGLYKNGGLIQISTEKYNKNYPLIIDPLIYSTYIGGDRYEQSEDIVIDRAGNTYITGHTASVNFPVTDGAYSKKLKETELELPDIFVSKFDSTGTELIFSTYIGGIMDDLPKGIALDDSGNVYIAGYTGETITFPVTDDAYDTLRNGGYDVFVVKLNPTGSELIYSTLIGGKYDDFAEGLTIDQFGNAYIIGYTTEAGNYPVTSLAYGQVHKGLYDIIVTKLNASGTDLLYSTYIGGSDDDFGEGIAVDSFGVVYITGSSKSDDFPTTEFAFDATFNDSTKMDEGGDVIACALNYNAGTLLYSTYIGGEGRDGGYGIAIDKNKNMYITGFSESADYPVTENVYDDSYNSFAVNLGLGDIIVTKIHKFTDSLAFSTFVGGSGSDRGFDIVLDDYNNCYLTGSTNSLDFPITLNTYDSSYNDTDDGADAFVCRVSNEGRSLTYSTYLGGDARDIGKGVDVFWDFSMYVTGTTSSHDFPLGPDAIDSTYSNSNGSDAFITKLMPSFLSIDAGGGSDGRLTVCRGDTVQIGSYASGGFGNVTYLWSPDEYISDINAAMPDVYPQSSATYTIRASDESGYVVSDVIMIDVLPAPEAEITGPEVVLINSNYSYLTPYDDSYSYTWAVEGGGIVSGQGTNEIVIRWTDFMEGYLFLEIDNNSTCKGYDTLHIIIGDYFKPVITVNGETEFCEGDTAILDAGAGYASYKWSTSDTTRAIMVTDSGSYWVVVTNDEGLAGVSDTMLISIHDTPPSPAIAKVENCLRCLLPAYKYQWYEGDILIPGADEIVYCPDNSGYYRIKIETEFGCYNFSDSLYMEAGSVPELIDNNGNIKIFPNPNTGTFQIEITNIDMIGKCSIKLIDLFGKTVIKKNIEITDGDLTLPISLSSFPKGTYILNILIGRHEYYAKIIYY